MGILNPPSLVLPASFGNVTKLKERLSLCQLKTKNPCRWGIRQASELRIGHLANCFSLYLPTAPAPV